MWRLKKKWTSLLHLAEEGMTVIHICSQYFPYFRATYTRFSLYFWIHDCPSIFDSPAVAFDFTFFVSSDSIHVQYNTVCELIRKMFWKILANL